MEGKKIVVPCEPHDVWSVIAVGPAGLIMFIIFALAYALEGEDGGQI